MMLHQCWVWIAFGALQLREALEAGGGVGRESGGGRSDHLLPNVEITGTGIKI